MSDWITGAWSAVVEFFKQSYTTIIVFCKQSYTTMTIWVKSLFRQSSMDDWLVSLIIIVGWLLLIGILVGLGFLIYFAVKATSVDGGTPDPLPQPADGASLNTQLQVYTSRKVGLLTVLKYFITLNDGFNLVPIVNTSDYTIYSKAHITSAAVVVYYRIEPAGISAVKDKWQNNYDVYNMSISDQAITISFNIASAGRTVNLKTAQILILK